jgi:Family of unknown function (DUF6115)
MESVSIEFWVVIQVVIDLILIVIILYLLQNIKKILQSSISKDAAEKTIGMLEPLLREADTTAKTFEKQLKKKSKLMESLNEKIDSRIISLNLLLNRAELHLNTAPVSREKNINKTYDHQESIFHLHMNGYDSEDIARKLSIPKGEVDLVIDLKNKLIHTG